MSARQRVCFGLLFLWRELVVHVTFYAPLVSLIWLVRFGAPASTAFSIASTGWCGSVVLLRIAAVWVCSKAQMSWSYPLYVAAFLAWTCGMNVVHVAGQMRQALRVREWVVTKR